MVSNKAIKRKLAEKKGELDQEDNGKVEINVIKKPVKPKKKEPNEAKKGFFSKLIDFTVDLGKKTDHVYKFIFKDPFEEIEKAKGRYIKGNITLKKFENIKRDNIKILIEKLTTENFQTNIKIAKNLLDEKTLDKDNYNEIKDYVINKFFIDNAMIDEDPISLIRKSRLLLARNIFNELDHEKIKIKCISRFNLKKLSALNYINELKRVKDLEKMDAIKFIEYEEIKNIFMTKFLDDEMVLDKDLFSIIEIAKSILDENLINEEEYKKIKNKINFKITSEFSSSNLFEELKKLKSLEKLEAIKNCEFEEMKSIFINKFLKNKVDENPLNLIERVKSLLDENILNKEEYEKIKGKCLKGLNTKSLGILDTFEELTKLKNLEESDAIMNTEYQEIRNIFVDMLLKYEILMEVDPFILIKKSKEINDKNILNKYEFEKIKKDIISKLNLRLGVDPFETIRKAKELFDLDILTSTEFENIKTESLNRNLNLDNKDAIDVIVISKKFLDEKIFTIVEYDKIKGICIDKINSKELSVLDSFEMLNKLKYSEIMLKFNEYDDIKNITISKILNDKSKTDGDSLTIIKEAKLLLDTDVINKSEYQKIKEKFVTEFNFNVELDLLELINKLKELEKHKAITSQEYNEIKNFLISNFLDNKIIIRVDVLIFIKNLKSLYSENVINKKEYEEMKKICITKISLEKLSKLDPCTELKKIKELKDIGAITEEEYIKLTDLYQKECFTKLEKLNKPRGILKGTNDWLKNKSLTISDRINIMEDYRDVESLICLLSPKCNKYTINRRYGEHFYTSSISINNWQFFAVEALCRMRNERTGSILYSLANSGECSNEVFEKICKTKEYRNENQRKTKLYQDELRVKRELVNQIKEKIRNNNSQIKKQILEYEDNNVIIDNFAKKYSDEYSDDKFYKLKDLLESQGNKIRDSIVTSLITDSIEKQRYKSFKEKILYNSPEKIDQYVFNFVEIYGENITSKLEYFFKLMKCQGYKTSEINLNSKIKMAVKEKEMKMFKDSLLDNEGFSIYEVDKLSGSEFEVFTKLLFEKIGYQSYKTKHSGDQGADLILKKFGEVTVVQAKRQNNKVTNRAIQEVVASISHYNADKGTVITNNQFTDSAVKLAKSNNIKLIDRSKLIDLIYKYPIKKTYLQKFVKIYL